ncbi:peptidoglycan DD-metalloendopeptidase family protein [Streptomyces sp. NPDC087897]|uniref:peptidoglycan DD-metalloendopeptidase family protein n=1 Tax=Streptomyces sp. NPDC087897 TaxID=3365817 RepID=UPI0037FEC5E2
MNDQHPPAGHVGYDGRSTGSFDTDPLFGSLSGDPQTGYAADRSAAGDGAYGAGYATTYATGQPDHSGPYDASAWNTGAQQTLTYDDGYAAPAPQVPQQWGPTGNWQQTADQDPTGAWPTADTGAFPTTGCTDAPYGTDTPYGTDSAYSSEAYGAGAYGADAYDTGTYPADTAYATGGAYGTDAYDTGAYPAGAYGTAAVAADTGTYATTAFATGTFAPGAQDTGTYDTGVYTAYGTTAYDTGAYDATAWNSGATPENTAYEPELTSDPAYEQRSADGTTPEGQAEPDRTTDDSGADLSSTAGFAVLAEEDAPDAEHAFTPDAAPEPDSGDDLPAPHSPNRTGVRTPAPRSRARRRSPAKRSALLTVAVPSACVMSVAGIAAASVGGLPGDDKPEEKTASMAIADPTSAEVVAANSRLDSQLEQLSEGSDDFRERASRTQERIDLRERQAAEKKKREEEAARREALRPKFVLPVKQHGLSAYYGQAGINWMSAHTGIDFPVSYGTPVMAATDGTVQTRWNSAYGNMAIVTAADGTETWYCHLSSTRIRSGPVKAGDVIGYAGDSGNSTGAHLHFEVRPGGGASIDPLVWLRGKGLNPT